MSRHLDYEKKTEELAAPLAEKHNFELVDVEFVKEAGSWRLRVYLDKEGGITLDDLTMVNHELSGLLDENDYIEETYVLEVSSPGLLRPFKKPRDFMRNLGEEVELKLFSPVIWEENGRKYSDKEFIGVLKDYDEGTSTATIDFGDRAMEVQAKDIALIRKYITF